jgi:hypothetical protein
MFEPRRVGTCALAMVLGVVVAPCEAVGQTDREPALRAELYATRKASADAREALDSARAGTIAVADRTRDLDGVTIRWAEGSFAQSDFDRIVDGIEAARASLDARFGDAGVQMLRGLRVEIYAPSRQRIRRPPVRIAASTEPNAQGASFAPPVDRAEVTTYILGQVGERLRRSAPALRRYPQTHLSLGDSPHRNALAAAHLAYGNSAPGRQCLEGALGACRAILTDAEGDRAKDLWYDAEDAPSIVRSTQHYAAPQSGAALATARKSCLEDGLAQACQDVVQILRPVYPYSGLVRGTFVAHAISLGGPDGLSRVIADSADATNPIATLARAAGMSEDSLVASWQRELRAARNRERRGTVPLTASAVIWCALMLIGASFRRP